MVVFDDGSVCWPIIEATSILVSALPQRAVVQFGPWNVQHLLTAWIAEGLLVAAGGEGQGVGSGGGGRGFAVKNVMAMEMVMKAGHALLSLCGTIFEALQVKILTRQLATGFTV